MIQQVLNARGSFTLSFFAPVLNNLVAITVFVSFILVANPLSISSLELPREQVALLGLGSTLGVALQALILLPALHKIGYRFNFNFSWKDSGLGKTLELAKWTIALIAVNQIAYIVITRFVTSANIEAVLSGGTAAGLTTYQKANLIYILPHSVITISLITALLPQLSARANQSDERGFAELVSSSLRVVLVLLVPIALFLYISAQELSVFLFGYGAAGIDSAAKVGEVTALFALGLPAFSLIYVINRIWYSTENTRTPFVFSIVINALAVGLGIALFSQVGVQDKVGMFGLSYTIAYWVVLGLSFWWLTRTVKQIEIPSLGTLFAKVIFASLSAAGIMQWVMSTWTDIFTGNSRTVFLALVVLWALCICVYFALASLLQVKEIKDVSQIVRKRFTRSHS
jgi:putative peptidoglycan lipid II flippase